MNDYTDFSELKPLMQRDIATLVKEWLPAGRRDGQYWIAPNPKRAKDKAGSFKVWLTGGAAGAFVEYDGGPNDKGDIIDLPVYCGVLRDRQHVYQWAMARYGFNSGDVELIKTRKAEAKQADQDAQAEAEKARQSKINMARKVWKQVRPLQPGDLAWRYLAEHRGVNLAELHRDPLDGYYADIGFLPRCLYIGPEGRQDMPAMVAAMRSADGVVMAVHRTYLDADTGAKARVANAKKMLGASTAAAIRVWTPQAPAALILTEGIEDAFSLAWAAPENAVWAVGSLNGLMSFDYPPEGPPAPRTIVFADNDWAGGPAAAMLGKAVRRLSTFTTPVSVARAHGGAKDANDLLRGDVS